MDRPPVNTEQSAGAQVQHAVWPCVPHPPTQDCVSAQEAYLRSKHALVPVRKAKP